MTQGAIAAWQMAPTVRDTHANLARLGAAADDARRRGATLLVTPELTLTGYDVRGLDGDLSSSGLVGHVAQIAHTTEIALVIGMALRQNGSTFNASVMVDAHGELRGIYAKSHLFRDLDASRFSAGPEASAVADIDGVRVGSVICYDIEFPEPARHAALQGAHVLAVPTANMPPWEIVNESVVPVRAFENQLYVAYANHVGHEGSTTYVGRSVIAAPDGRTVRAGPRDEEIIVMPFDTDDIARRRREATHLADRRPALYRRLSEEES